ncbi:MAG TPA: hypothetical protein VH062_30125 [Polyangiaceae bacterium]|nr:hypothetical protein [Polyangiaceae bacterium]
MSLLVPSVGCSSAVESEAQPGAKIAGAVRIDPSAAWTWNPAATCSRDDATTVLAGFSGLIPVRVAAPALDGEHLYLAADADDGTPPVLLSIPMPCGKPVVLAHLATSINGGLAYSDGSLYWASTDGIFSMSIATRSIRRLADMATVVPGNNFYPLLAVHGGYVYWAAVDGTVARIATSGGDVTVLASGYGGPGALAVDDDAVYWSSLSPAVEENGAQVAYGAIESVPSGGGDVLTLADHEQAPDGIVPTATDVYWSDSGTWGVDAPAGPGAIMVKARAGDAPALFAGGQASPELVGATDDALYWTAGGAFGTSLEARPLSGNQGPSSAPLSAQPGTSGVTLFSGRIYYVEWSGSDVSMSVSSRPL